MEELNLPIYRAEVDIDIENTYESTLRLLKSSNGKYYVIGFLLDNNKISIKKYITTTQMGTVQLVENRDWFLVKQETLSISFPDMLDNEGTRIFASLSNSGKGGDILASYSSLFGTISPYICVYQNMRIRMRELDNTDVRDLYMYPKVSKVIGIQE